MSGPPPEPLHAPVLLTEVLEQLRPADGDIIVDGTFGAGGYTRAILASARCRVLALDRDPAAIADGAGLVAAAAGRLTLVESPFGDLDQVLHRIVAAERTAPASDSPRADAVVLDIGVSSMQLDQPGRGFSFMADGPLDMRMASAGASAADLVASAPEELLADIVFHLGEERQARRIARAVVRAREKAPVATTRRLAEILEQAVGRSRSDARHPATRTFQALRIHVNDELGQLARGLAAAERILGPGGRLVVVTFHSLEDRVVKRFLARRGKPASAGSRHAPPAAGGDARLPSFRIVNQRPLEPGAGEVAANPRSRSARLRAAVRTGAEPWPPEDPRELGIPMIGVADRRH